MSASSSLRSTPWPTPNLMGAILSPFHCALRPRVQRSSLPLNRSGGPTGAHLCSFCSGSKGGANASCSDVFLKQETGLCRSGPKAFATRECPSRVPAFVCGRLISTALQQRLQPVPAEKQQDRWRIDDGADDDQRNKCRLIPPGTPSRNVRRR